MILASRPSQGDPGFEFPSLKRIGEFIRNVLELERLMRRLDQRNGKLEEELRLIQRQVDEHGGQLKALTTFVSNSADKAESRSEEIALRTIERYIQTVELARLTSMRDDEGR